MSIKLKQSLILYKKNPEISKTHNFGFTFSKKKRKSFFKDKGRHVYIFTYDTWEQLRIIIFYLNSIQILPSKKATKTLLQSM